MHFFSLEPLISDSIYFGIDNTWFYLGFESTIDFKYSTKGVAIL